MATILVVEDDANMRMLTCARLKTQYTVLSAENGKEALALLDNQHADLIVADVMMPEMDGYEMIRALRDRGSNIPVLMVTAKSAVTDRCKGFASGTDDYMIKPIDHEELLWRIAALLRRCKIAKEKKIVIGGVTVDENNFTVTVDGQESTLPAKEFRLLYLLLSYPNKVFTKDELLDKVWGYDSFSDDSTVRVHIGRLRARFENCGEFEIATLRGIGYKAVIRKQA